jgi:nitric oxide reductase activation protein
MERKGKAKSARVASVGLALYTLFLSSPSLAQHISIKLADPHRALLHIDSADWSDAWIEVNGESPDAKPLTKTDLVVSEGNQQATILSIDSIGARYRSDLALSFVLDNSGSMFHAYDSLTRFCDSLIDSLPRSATFQAAVFDNAHRTDLHLYTRRSNVFIALKDFTASTRAVSSFWHYYDSIRTSYTPLYDAIAAAVRNLIERRLRDSLQRNDLLLVITDGEDNASRTSIEDLEELCESAHVRLFAINFRTEPDQRLIWLTNRTHSAYYYAEDLHDLHALLKDMSRRIARQYHISYRFPSLGPSGTNR